MFCISQRGKDGTVGSSAQELMDKFNDLSTSQAEAEGSESVNEDDIYHKVVGPERHGRVRTYGLGPTPSVLFGSTPGRTELLTRLDEADKRNEEISIQFQELSKEVDDLKKNGEEERKKMEEERKKLEEGLKKVDEERRRMEEDRRIMQENFEKLMQEERKRNADFMNTLMNRMTSKSGPSKRLERFSMSK